MFAENPHLIRWVEVPESCEGMRLDRFLARRFPDWSRTTLVSGIKEGQVCDSTGQPLRPSSRLRAHAVLGVTIPGLAPSSNPPPFPPILHEDEHLIVVDKPAGLLCHPAGSNHVWALISLAKMRWSDQRIDLVHRLDRDTSGCIVLTKTLEANQFLKAAIKAGEAHKCYTAICRGEVTWDKRTLTGPIGSDGGVVRIKMAVRETGLQARTDVEVLERAHGMTRVSCILHTGRTHQIRVHLDHEGYPLLGDRLYGVPPEIFLHSLDHGQDARVRLASGAPYHALHAASLTIPHPDGSTLYVHAAEPAALTRWWQKPQTLPHDPQDDP